MNKHDETNASSRSLDLSSIPDELHDLARDAFEARDAMGLLMRADNMRGLDVVWRNRYALKARGILEECILIAVTNPRTNNRYSPKSKIVRLLAMADRRKLLAAGDPLPAKGRFTLYRGIAGHGRARRPRGFSWTSSLQVARWFANRFSDLGVRNPAVYQATVRARDVLFYSNDRDEEEFFILIPDDTKLIRVAEERNAVISAS